MASHQWKGVFWVFEKIRSSGLKPNGATYGLAMEVYTLNFQYFVSSAACTSFGIYSMQKLRSLAVLSSATSTYFIDLLAIKGPSGI